MDCISTHDLSYGAFSERLHARVGQNRLPLNGSLEVTARCNMRCEHCYLPFAQRFGSQQNELAFSEIQRIFSEIADAGCLWLLLTGGEPFLREDFMAIYDDAKRKGFIITIFTNGTLITEQVADHLAEWIPFLIEISLYGATQATYDRVTGVAGSFYRCMRSIEMLLERGLPLKLKSVLITLNQHEILKMQQLAESLGVDFRFDAVINAGLDGSLYPTRFRLSPEQIIAIEKQDPYRAQKWPEYFEKHKGVEINTLRMYTCGAGKSAFHVDSTGHLCLCLSARNPCYDLRKGSFLEGWETFIPGVLALEYDQEFSCVSCKLRAVCSQCPAMGFTELGDSEVRVPFLCKLAHLRHEAFSFDIPVSN